MPSPSPPAHPPPHPLTPPSLHSFDLDGSGAIDHDELKQVLRNLGQVVDDGKVDEMIKEYDIDGNGQLDYNEFLSMMARLTNGPSEKEILAEMFSVRKGGCEQCCALPRPVVPPRLTTLPSPDV